MQKTTKILKSSPLDSLIGELINYSSDDTQSVIDILFTRDQRAITSIPLRYRIIGLGFVKQLSLQEVNEKLVANGCEKLYGRSIYEASLMHAFNSGLSYQEWKSLLAECSDLRQALPVKKHLSGSSISLNDITAYVQDNSDIVGNVFKTQHLTQEISDSLSAIPPEKKAVLDFMIKNIQSFSLSRECTRYYFCKYLMYFLESRRDNYLKALELLENSLYDPLLFQQRLSNSLDMLSVFRSHVKLTRQKNSVEEAKRIIDESPLSLSELYDAFQQFYFEYTSVDWMTLMLEYYGDLSALSAKQKGALADSIRRYRPTLKKLSDDEVISWQIKESERLEDEADRKCSADNKKPPAASRTGEVFLRKVLRGDIDLDRTTFLAFLLFFDKGSSVPVNQQIGQKRLDEILHNCGFPALNAENPFDSFFMDYINSDDPMLFLIEEAEIMAMSEENFYLYKSYLSSIDNEKELIRVMKDS